MLCFVWGVVSVGQWEVGVNTQWRTVPVGWYRLSMRDQQEGTCCRMCSLLASCVEERSSAQEHDSVTSYTDAQHFFAHNSVPPHPRLHELCHLYEQPNISNRDLCCSYFEPLKRRLCTPAPSWPAAEAPRCSWRTRLRPAPESRSRPALAKRC